MNVTPLTKDDQLADARRDKHPRGCECKPCQGRRNRRSGLKKQRDARKLLHIPSAKFVSQNGNEELWRGAVRAEVKSGKQVESLTARFLAAERQSDQNKSFGDTRDFVFVAMPVGMSDGLVCFRLSKVAQITEALADMIDQWD